jgi:hypothetical protein
MPLWALHMLSLLKTSDLLLEWTSSLERFRELWAFALSIQYAPLGIYRPYYGANQFAFIHTTSLGICVQAGFWQWPTVGVCQSYGSIPTKILEVNSREQSQCVFIQSSCNSKHCYIQPGVLWFLLFSIGEFQQVRLSFIFLVMFLI